MIFRSLNLLIPSLTFLLFGLGSSQAAIYGTDSRRDIYDTNDFPAYRQWARSVALVTTRFDLTEAQAPSMREARTTTAGERKELCEGEAFSEQPSFGFCTGFLIGSNLMATAGHCVKSCGTMAFVFDFTLDEPDRDLSVMPASNIYYCKELIAKQYLHGRGLDFAIVRLDRPALDRRPLPINQRKALRAASPLAAIGHPFGLPTKVCDKAIVREDSHPDYFVTNTDTFTVSSGSPVFNLTSGLVEGILVRGERDLEFDNVGNCYRVKQCPPDGCRGEDVVRAKVLGSYLPKS